MNETREFFLTKLFVVICSAFVSGYLLTHSAPAPIGFCAGATTGYLLAIWIMDLWRDR